MDKTILCLKCLRTLTLEHFYDSCIKTSGPFGECKDCTRDRVTRNRHAKADYYREYDKQRWKSPKRVSSTKRYRSSELGKQTAYKGNARYRARNQNKYDAHKRVTAALASGKLVRPLTCEQCGGSFKIQAHHEDYSRPLDVSWLCEPCHIQRHHSVAA